MKIVVLDGYTLNPGDLSWDALKNYGDLVVYDRTEDQDIIERIGDSDVVFTNKTLISKEILFACPSIKFIGVLATGYNVVDIDAARALNIPVCNIPTYGTDAVSQYVFALLLAICHRVEMHSETVFKGEWAESKDFCYWHSPLIELAGKTMGIIGAGRIGKRTAEIANAFGMKVIAFDHHPNKAYETEMFRFAELDEVYRQADVISLHVPLFEETKGMINKSSIEKMKDGVIIINTSRGPLIDEVDLTEALKSGKVKAAALDVVSTEPIKTDNALLSAPNLLITPHIAWAPKESRARLMSIAVDNLKGFIDGNLQNVVNK
ncbi:MAG TPA: glycerate dehydrogenase [Clostridiales bacterium UBA8960]|jgi:glycerate dehydrogenase|nr:glycerate dehydrogenase [Clostridiales bacterium UBA8960]